MNDNPLVSVVLTSYNQPELLSVAFHSLIEQTYENIEIIIVDDCSTNPQNLELISEYRSTYPDKVKCVVHSKNNGIAANKNSGFKIAIGEFITYLDGDDFYLPSKIENEVRLFQEQPDLDVVYTNFFFTKASGEKTKDWTNEKMPEGFIFRQIVKEEFPEKILFRSELVRRNIYTKLNFYDEDIKIYHDWDFRIRYALNSKIGYVPLMLSAYRRTEESITIKSSLSKMSNEKLYVITKNRKLIENDIELMEFYKNFRKGILIGNLFDTRVSFKAHIGLCVKMLFKYPSKIIVIGKSVIHYQLFKNNRTITL